MKAIMVMFDSLNRGMLPPYGYQDIQAPNFERLARRTVVFDNCYAGSMPCMPARRELHTGRYNFLHRSWGPLEPYDDSMPRILKENGIYTHITTDHWHYWEEGGCNYLNQYNSYEFVRGQEGDPFKGLIQFEEPAHLDGRKDFCGRQEFINRHYMQEEEQQSITQNFSNGLQFIRENYEADNWYLRQNPKVLNLPFIDGIRRADRDNAIDLYIGEDYMDVLADGRWEKIFKEKPEVFTREEKRAWLDGLTDVALGSDAFFPFGDNIDRAHKSGVKYVAQPGGSVRDDQVIDTCNQYGMVMAFTGIRLFHH